MKLKMTLDELINTMEPQVRKDKALISKCIDGLTEYAAELRQKAGDPGKAQTPDLRRLVSELEGCWGLDTEVVDYVAAFDRKIQEADQATHPWAPTQEQRGAVMKGICLHSVDIISSLGADDARGRVAGCERLIVWSRRCSAMKNTLVMPSSKRPTLRICSPEKSG